MHEAVGGGAAAVGDGIERPMHGEVGIAADGGGEVAVAVARKRVVAVLLRAVGRAGEASQHGVVHGVLLGLAPGHVEQPLELEAAFQRVDFETQFGDKLGELPEFPRVGGGVNPPQKTGPCDGQG